MTLDLDTFLVALYTLIDDLYQARLAPQLPRGPGKRPTLSDSAELTLALCAQWLRRSERAVVRDAMACWRQIVETVDAQHTDVFGLPFPGARSACGLLTRVAAKIPALNLGIWLNRLFGRPDLALATLFVA